MSSCSSPSGCDGKWEGKDKHEKGIDSPGDFGRGAVRAADLAALVGYTEYYLTHKFKAETGLCINDYIKFAKIERAKVLLKSTDQTVQEIAASLCFSTRNYFSRIFQEVTGQTPMEYREG